MPNSAQRLGTAAQRCEDGFTTTQPAFELVMQRYRTKPVFAICEGF